MLDVPRLDAAGWTALFEAWRLVTWPLYQGARLDGLLTFLFAGVMLVWLGQLLSYAWSERRFVLRVAAITVGAALLTLLLLVPLNVSGHFFGAWPVTNALLFTWGLVFPRQRISWFGAIDMTGATVAKIVVIGTPVWALLAGAGGSWLGQLAAYTPHMMALLVAWTLVTGGPRRLWYRLRQGWLERSLERKRRRFQVVTGSGKNGRIEPPTWMN